MIDIQTLQPILSRVTTAGEAIGLNAHEILHAGPPLTNPQNPPPVLMSSAVMTALHEGWAHSEQDAEKLVRDGIIEWRCAQDHRCVTPLAATVSQNTPLFEVTDPNQQLVSRFSVVSPVRGADTRMGHRDSELPARLKARDEHIAPAWQDWLAANGPLSLWPIGATGLAGGDDLHYRTTSASEALGLALAQAGGGDWTGAISETPTYFLTLWMATCAMLLDASGRGPCETAVVRVGGNGESFGIALAQNISQWVSGTATPPLGVRMAGAENAAACPAIGDSAVIDIAGFGAQGLQWAAEARKAFSGAGVLPADYADIASSIGVAKLPGQASTRWTGVDAQKVLAQDSTPLIALAILASDGRQGLLGRGIYRTERSVFEKALMT